jgi:hypothetical protein
LNRKIKLIWDFRGPDALETAKHHTMHLKEFATMENLHFYEAATEQTSEHHAIACMIIDEKDLLTFRDALHPHRAVVTA